MGFRLCFCTCPDSPTAKSLSNRWLENRWAACVNEIPQIISRYHWEGKVQEDHEVLLIVKTTTQGAKKIESDLKSHHPYDCPEWIEVSPDSLSPLYGKWIQDSCSF